MLLGWAMSKDEEAQVSTVSGSGQQPEGGSGPHPPRLSTNIVLAGLQGEAQQGGSQQARDHSEKHPS